jgi:hypothetical protein
MASGFRATAWAYRKGEACSALATVRHRIVQEMPERTSFPTLRVSVVRLISAVPIRSSGPC